MASNIFDQDWFSWIGDINKDWNPDKLIGNGLDGIGEGIGLGKNSFSDSIFGKPSEDMYKWSTSFDNAYKEDAGTRSTTNAIAAILAAIYGGAALGGGEGAGAGAAGDAGWGAAGGHGGAEAAWGGGGALGDAGWGEAGGHTPGFDWMKFAQKGLNGMSSGGDDAGGVSGDSGYDKFDPYGLKLSGLPADSFKQLPVSSEDKRQRIIDEMTRKDGAF